MARASGASQAATGAITANTDSTLTLVHKSDCVLVTNYSKQACYCRVNGAVSATVYDFILETGDKAWVTAIDVETVHVYVNATSGVRVVHW